MSRRFANVAPRRTPETWTARFLEAPPEGPKYLAIAAALAHAVETGELSAGARLPPQRRLARDLGVDLTTITRAYAAARAMGLLDGEVGRGTFVRNAGSASGPIVDLSMNLPPPPGALSLRDLITQGIAEVLRDGDPAALMSYRGGMGSRRDRAAAALWLAPRLGDIALDRVFVAPGAQSALAALLPLIARPGDVTLAEPHTYPGFLGAARLHGVRLAAMACDAEGPLPDGLAALCEQVKPRGLYLTPTLQNPTARTMSAARRIAVIEIARRYDLSIIEDDAYGAFLPEFTPLARLAPERVFHVSTLSKCLSPGLRTAFVVAPEAARGSVGEALRAAALMPVPVLSDVATRWIETGAAQTLFKAVKTESAARMRLARGVLPKQAQGNAAGFHLWLAIPAHWTLSAYLAAARERGVVVVGSDSFAVGADPTPSVRISLGAAADRGRLEHGLKALTALSDR